MILGLNKTQRKGLLTLLALIVTIVATVWKIDLTPLLTDKSVATLRPSPTTQPIISPSPIGSPVLGVSDHLPTDLFLVTRIIDGDTIELENGQKVRYVGINTPEIHHPQKGQECFGQEAAAKNKDLVLQKYVRLEKDVSETDRYGRLLRYVWIDDQLINQLLVAQGYALASSYPPDIAHQEEFRQAESQARTNKVGLWASCQL